MNGVRQVSPLLWCGPRPESAKDVVWLRDTLGVRKIINIQGDVLEHFQVRSEASWCLPYDVQFLHFLWNLVTPPNVEQIQQVLAAVCPTPLGAPIVYLHCHDGVDRTGVAVMAFRITTAWSFGRAVGEMIDNGFHLDKYSRWLPHLQRVFARQIL